ncbi:SDR family NAD(P)-dependent oxidoreductase [Psychroflexus sp. MES1-P1E]|uniref:SDR family NAD(P)-dependent oxidoreductase n=1 Tax=Psychroflexus sp. MES1-P1E TaxID=2058320 RepID=UPI000C7966D2|nr:SDR family oxidoreductase [Psychroflexus sp. MES1-P1E]PKG42911.1 short-chain dehydrogenase [Psychroflexus sp. MES1-P1E]
MIQNKNTVITGASEGIGFAIAERFVRDGANVIIISRNQNKLDEAAKVLSKYGTEVHTIAKDLSNTESIKELVFSINNIWSTIDVLVNNAGIALFEPMEDVKLDTLDSMINLNLKAPYLLTQGLLSSIKKSKGNIINISSYFSDRMISGRPSTVYSLTKGAINSLTKSLANEIGNTGVRVNAIAPGSVNTSLLRKTVSQMTELDKEKFEKTISQIYPLGRIGQPDEIADLAIFLASENSKWMTGSIINLDGGLRTN